MGSLDEANNMPEHFVFLMPGGCAAYEIPVPNMEEQNETFLMVRPGKKEGAHRWDYKDKANLTLTASAEEIMQTECSVEASDGSKEASDYFILNVTSLIKVSLKLMLRLRFVFHQLKLEMRLFGNFGSAQSQTLPE